jgi:hypothetical protein
MVPAGYTGAWRYLFSWVANRVAFAGMQADGNPVTGPCLSAGHLVRQPPEDFGR